MSKTLIAKFAGTCTRCRGHFPAGTSIIWTKGLGSHHANPVDCANAIAQPVPAPVTVNLKSIADFLWAAQLRKLKFPKVRFLAPGGTGELRLALAGRGATVVGSIQVVVNDQWVGRVEPPHGNVVGKLRDDQVLIDYLLQIARNPAEAASAYGALIGRCSFCHLKLTDEGSIEVGYGPDCARHYGLSHRPKGTRTIGEVA